MKLLEMLQDADQKMLEALDEKTRKYYQVVIDSIAFQIKLKEISQ